MRESCQHRRARGYQVTLELVQELGMVPKPEPYPVRKYNWWQLLNGQAIRDDKAHHEWYNAECKRIAAEYADKRGLVTVRSRDYVLGWADAKQGRMQPLRIEGDMAMAHVLGQPGSEEWR